jgi:phosphoribosylformimino-5-aminoimidazole carboxamide ribotide isomerase
VNVIPVLDLKDGLVVRGVAGQREQYRPVESEFAVDARPQSVARGLVARFGFDRAYIADLDAIAGVAPAWEVYEAVASSGLKLLIDAGVSHLSPSRGDSDLANASRFVDGVVVGLESVESPSQLLRLGEVLGSERAVFSLDLKLGKPITAVPEWRGAAPAEIATQAVECGFRQVIVLDLATVGVNDGPSVVELCAHLHKQHPDVRLISGGGVRNIADIQQLCSAGCESVLVASALHNGSLSPADLRQIA